MTPAVALSSDLIRLEVPSDAVAIQAVVARAFGPGRLARAAERLREGRRPVVGFTAWVDGRLAGTVRLWPIRVGHRPMLFLGPIAVEAGERNGGLGAELVGACLAWAGEQGGAGVLLVGDPPYFERFGFTAAPDVAMPGPVDQRRVLWRPGVDPAPPGGPARPS